MSATASQVTSLLGACSAGERGAADRLFTLVYDDLRNLAHRHLRGESDGHTLNTTALVHELYVALADPARTSWRDRTHFLAVASRAMRHILIDHARTRRAVKRGGAYLRVPLTDDLHMPQANAGAIDLVDLDDALVELAQHDPRMARVVECRFFGGMSVEETAEALGVGVRTVERDWTRARAYLYQRLQEPSP